MSKRVTVIQGEKETTVEVIAASVKAISDGIKKLRSGPLNDKALVLLIQHSCPYKAGRYGSGMVTANGSTSVFDNLNSVRVSAPFSFQRGSTSIETVPLTNLLAIESGPASG